MKRTRKLPKSVRTEEWELLVKQVPIKDKKFLIGFLLAYGSGLRISEVLRVNKDHIRKVDGSIFIPESKYGVERVVPLPKGWRLDFESHIPLSYSGRTLQRKFKFYCKKANLNSSYTFHSLRHGFATRLLEKGTPINIVQLALGHSNISTTSIYTKASPQDLLRAYRENF